MPKVKVNQSRLSSIDNDFQQAIRQLGMVTNQFQAVASNIDWDIKAKSNVNRRLTRLSRELQDELNALQGFARFTQEAQRRYDQTEREISQRIGHVGDSDQGSTYSGVGKAVPNQPGLRRPQQVVGGSGDLTVCVNDGNIQAPWKSLVDFAADTLGDQIGLIDDATGSNIFSKVGIAVSGGINFLKNLNEESNDGDWDRILGETGIETGIDFLVGAGIKVGITAGLSLFSVAAPPVVVGEAAIVVAWGLNQVVENITGKGIGEHVSDAVMDTLQGKNEAGKMLYKEVERVGKAAQDLGNKVADGWNAVTKWGSSLFGFG